ncbi:DUF664 domain-containing protein [Actinoplanes sp. NPDC020271]|uniref:mycothiol transferase n=1 Tax=Actinoplanes sp. NPDC020271 TaxID=3363896 RepID=UPI0037AAD544
MLETQRERVPLDDDGELDTAPAFPAFARSCVLKKTDGLDEEQLRRRLVVPDTTLLGLVQHRWLIAHVSSETVRHAGYADILRELIDGVTGR